MPGTLAGIFVDFGPLQLATPVLHSLQFGFYLTLLMSQSFGKEAFLWQSKCNCLLKCGSLLPAKYAYRPNSDFDPLILPRFSGRRRIPHCGLFDWPQPVHTQNLSSESEKAF